MDEEEHNETFKSVNQFEDQNSENNSIIDIVNESHSPNQ